MVWDAPYIHCQNWSTSKDQHTQDVESKGDDARGRDMIEGTRGLEGIQDVA